MTKLVIGAGLLVAALMTGVIAGSLDEPAGRATQPRPAAQPVVSREAPVAHTRFEEQTAEAPAAEPRAEDAAPVQAKQEESPETSGLVERMRRHLPGLAEWQADEVRRYHKGYKKKLHAHGMGIAAVLQADPEQQRRAVAAMREVRRERNEFLRTLLGPEKFESWRRIEISGGRDVDEFLRGMQER